MGLIVSVICIHQMNFHSCNMPTQGHVRPALLFMALALAFVDSSVLSQITIYTQDFEAYADGTTTSSAWTTSIPGATDFFAVYNNSGDKEWWGDDTDGAATWLSESIDVSAYTNLSLAIFLGESDNQDSDDYIRVSYVLDGTTVQLVQFNNDFGTSSQSGLTIPDGSSLQIEVVMDNDDNNESHYFDDIVVTGVCSGSDVDNDGICDDGGNDNCTDTSASNYDDAANENCQYQVFHEPFTDDSQFSVSPSFAAKSDGKKYFGIWDADGNTDDFGGDTPPSSEVPSFGGIDGNILIGEKTKDGYIGANPGILTWSGIDISGFEAGLTFEIDIAESGASDNEYVELYAKLSTSSSYTLLIDPGSDIGSIGSTLTKQTASGSFDGSSLDIQLRFKSNDEDDEIAVDDLRVLGTSSCTAVAVSADVPSVSLSSGGTVSVSAGESGAGVTVSSTGDCFTLTGYEISKTSASAGFGASVSFDCNETGSQNIWVRATDGTNVSAATATTVTVQDVTPPTIGTLSGTYYLGEGGGSTASTRRIWWATATDGNGDNCGLATKKVSKTGNDWGSATNYVDFDCSELGPQTLYLQGTDAAGNVAEGSGTITIADNTNPTITAPATVNANTSAYGGTCTIAATLLTLGTPTTSDNCSVGSVTNDAPSTYATGTTLVTWTVTDGSGNTSTATQDVVVVENQLPTISSVSSGLTESLSSAGGATIDASTYITASDNCTAEGSLIYEVSETSGSGFATTFAADCNDVGAKTFYFRVTDAAGNISSEASETITIADNTAPVAVANAVTLFMASGTVSLAASNGTFNASTDACGIVTSEVKLTANGNETYASSLTFTSAADYNVTLRVTDGAGHASTATATVSVLFQVVNGCTDQTACNYSATANTNDGSCHYPGEECQAPAAGLGYVYTVNVGLNGCDCTARDFEQVYFEDFGPGGASGGQGSGYGYEGYANVSNEVNSDVNAAAAETEWTLGFNDPNVGNGTLDGTESDYWTTINVVDGNGVTTDTVFDGLYLVNACSWTTKILSSDNYDHIRIQAQITEDGVLEGDDYIKVRLIEDDVVSTGTLGEVIDDSSTPFPAYKTVDVTQSTSASVVQVTIEALNDAAGEYHTFDDVVVSLWGKEGCTDVSATSGYDATAQVDDGSCGYAFATAYSRFDGGFEDKVWGGTSCGGDCGSAPHFDARQVAANSQTSGTAFNYVISAGTTVTVNGTTGVEGDPTTKDLFVHDLTIQPGGALVIPAGKRLRITGKVIDNDGNAISGQGMLCIDGVFEMATNGPAVVNVQNFELAPSSTLTVPSGKTLAVNGDLTFGSTAPTSVSGLVKLSGSSQQTISGAGATLDGLLVSNSSGVVLSDPLEIQGILTLTSGALDMGGNVLVFASKSGSGSEEKTAVLDAIPSGASMTGTTAGVEVQRYISADTDGVTFSGYTLYSSPIAGAVVGDLAGITGFYLAGWPGTSWPNSFSTVLFWDESSSAFVEPSSNNTPLDTLGGAWIALAGSQTPTMSTTGALNSHVVGDSKTFGLTRSDNANTADEFEGWNLIYNPYQARLDWHLILDNASNASLMEDQYAVYDTQSKQFVRYSETNTQLASASRYIEPGQSFWVRIPSGTSSGTLTLTPSMIDNQASGSAFVRSASEGELTVLLETSNSYGSTQSLLRFSDLGEPDAYMQGDLSRLGSSSVRSGEMAYWADGQQYVAKTLPHDVEGELYVRSRSNVETTMRVLEVTGDPAFCGHILDTETGAVMVLQEGEEMAFTLPNDDAAAGRFTLTGSRFAHATGVAPECEDSEAGTIVLELGEAVADVLVINYTTMEEAGLALQATGTLEVPVAPGEYAIEVSAMEGTSYCRGGRRQVVVAPGEQPELLGLSASPAACNVGLSSLAFELYGGGVFEASLVQGAETVWSEALLPGEHVLEGIAPGGYGFKVNHTCLEVSEWVVLTDPGVPSVTPIYPFFTEVEASGGAWLSATCMGCETGEGFGYHWLLNGVVVGEDVPLEVRVEAAGVYGLELVAFGPDCQVGLPFEMLVGANKVASPDEVRWGGVNDHVLSVTVESEWSDVTLRWYDSAGRLLASTFKGTMVGAMGIQVPQPSGWLTLEMRNAEGRVARWSGIPR